MPFWVMGWRFTGPKNRGCATVVGIDWEGAATLTSLGAVVDVDAGVDATVAEVVVVGGALPKLRGANQRRTSPTSTPNPSALATNPTEIDWLGRVNCGASWGRRAALGIGM